MLFFDEIRVFLYEDLAAIILTLGVIVLCSRGIITDNFEGKLFRCVLWALLFLSVVNIVATIVGEYTINNRPVMILSTWLWGLQMIAQIALACALFIYLNYRIYRSKDTIKRLVVKRLIPLYVLAGVVLINNFGGFLFYYDSTGEYHDTFGLYIYCAILAVYFFISVLEVAVHKRKFNDLRFFDIWSLIIPTILIIMFGIFTNYDTIALGFALGMTNVYVGIVNEKSFQDRQTGFFNRFYMRYLRKDIENESYNPKSGIVFTVEDENDIEPFSNMLRNMLNRKHIVIRYKKDMLIMFAEVSDKMALQMMAEDVEAGLEQLNKSLGDKTVSVKIDTFFKKRKETPADFYDTFLKKIG